MSAPEEDVVVDSLPTPHEAEMMRSKLESEGISASLRDSQTVGADARLGMVIGGVKVVVGASDAERARELIAATKKAALSNQGKPVFRIRATRTSSGAMIGAGIGALAGAIATMFVSYPFLIAALALAGGIAGGFNGRRIRADYCSGLGCAALLTPDASVCSKCGGNIAGTIDDPDDRLEAEENLRRR
jgi:hypothetical protein